MTPEGDCAGAGAELVSDPGGAFIPGMVVVVDACPRSRGETFAAPAPSAPTSPLRAYVVLVTPTTELEGA